MQCPVQISKSAQSTTSKHLGQKTLVLLCLIYVLSFQPFQFYGYFGLPDFVRLLIEGITILFLITFSLYRMRRKFILWFLIFSAVFTFSFYVIPIDESKYFLSIYNKIIFSVFFLNMFFSFLFFRQFILQAWIAFGWLLIVYSVIAVIGYYSKIFSFINLNNATALGFGDYGYYFNSFLGNILQKKFSLMPGFTLPRYSWWVAEPGQYSYIFAFNIWIAQYLNMKNRKTFLLGNTFAGVFTLSGTFFVFLGIQTICYFVLKARSSFRYISGFFILICFSFFFLFLPMRIVGTFTSVGDRIDRFNNWQELFMSGDIPELIFGHGVFALSRFSGYASSSGILTILLERGLILFIPLIIYIFINTYKNIEFLLLIIIYLLAFDFVGWPIFWLTWAMAAAIVLKFNGKQNDGHSLPH